MGQREKEEEVRHILFLGEHRTECLRHDQLVILTLSHLAQEMAAPTVADRHGMNHDLQFRGESLLGPCSMLTAHCSLRKQLDRMKAENLYPESQFLIHNFHPVLRHMN